MTKSLQTNLALAPVKAVAIATLIMGAILWATSHQTVNHDMGKPMPSESAASVIETYGCWTGEAPADMQNVIPGHVLLSTPTGPVLGGQKKVEKAFEQIFDNIDHDLKVIAFCR